MEHFVICNERGQEADTEDTEQQHNTMPPRTHSSTVAIVDDGTTTVGNRAACILTTLNDAGQYVGATANPLQAVNLSRIAGAVVDGVFCNTSRHSSGACLDPSGITA